MDKITVKYGKLKKVVEAIEELNPTDDMDISFEYVVGSCFPNIMENIERAMRQQYTLGFVEGQKGENN